MNLMCTMVCDIYCYRRYKKRVSNGDIYCYRRYKIGVSLVMHVIVAVGGGSDVIVEGVVVVPGCIFFFTVRESRACRVRSANSVL